MTASRRFPVDPSISISLKQLEAFVMSSRLGGFSAAASALGRAQPTVSKEIRQLERMTGCTLFVRGGWSCALDRRW